MPALTFGQFSHQTIIKNKSVNNLYLVIALVTASVSASANEWNLALSEKYKNLTEAPISPYITGAVVGSTEDELLIMLQAGNIREKSWPSDSPRPIFIAWCPAQEINGLVNRLRVTMDTSSALPLNRKALSIQIEGAVKKFGDAFCDDSRMIMGVNVNAGAYSGSCDKPGMEFPMPYKGAILVVESSEDESKRPVLLFWKAEVNWDVALASMANTDCWKLNADGGSKIGRVKGLESKRGAAVILVTCVAPGGRIFYGVNTASHDFFPKDRIGDAQNSFILQWGHGVAGPEQFQNPSLTWRAIIGNGLPAQAKLMGSCLINSDLKPGSPLKLSTANGDLVSSKISKQCPLPATK